MELFNVLYLSYDGLTDPLGQSQILPYLCGISKKYAITVISFEKKGRFEMERKLIEEICIKNKIEWIPFTYHKNPPIFSTIYDLMKLRQIVKVLHRTHNFKIVHCRSYLTSLIGLWMKRHYSISFIFDMRGFWADERVEGGLWNLRNPLYRIIYNFFKGREKKFLKNADEIISLTQTAKREIISWEVTAAHITVVPCCVDMDLFNGNTISTEQQDLLRRDLGIKPDEFVLLYLGSIGTWYLVNEMLDFFVELKKTQANARFLFITPESLDVGNYVHKQDVIIRRALRNEIPLLISLANAAIIFIKPSFSKKASSATKMGEILAMGVPVITNKNWGDVETLIENTSCGVLINSFTALDYNLSMNELLKRKVPVQVIRETAERNFSLTLANNAYSNVYEKLVNNSTFNN